MATRAGVERLIEREAELLALSSAVDRACAGVGALVVVEGPAGIGKSRIGREAGVLAAEGGFRVLRASGGELEHDVTYGVARQLFERLLDDAGEDGRSRLLAGPARLALAALGDGSTPVRFSSDTGLDHGFYWLVSNLATEGPVALIIDDAHWADAATLRSLVYLARRLDGLPVLILLAARPRERGTQSRLLDLLCAQQSCLHLVLAPLSVAGTVQLLDSRLTGTVLLGLARACHEVSGGNPFFLGEIATALAETDGQDEAQAIGHVRSLVPLTVRRSILLRLGRESGRAQAAAEVLAVLGDGAAVEVLRLVAGIGIEAAVAGLAELAEAGFVTRAGQIGFVHPIIRTAIYADLQEARRRALHAAAARSLLELGATPEDVAHHLGLTEPRGDATAVATLLEAGERALARGAAATAVRLLSRARQEPPARDQRGAVLLALGRAELAAGFPVDAAGHLREALAPDPPSALRVPVALALSQALVASQDQRGAIDVLRSAGDGLDGDDALQLDVARTSLALYVTDLADDALARTKEYAAFTGETTTELSAIALSALGCCFDPRAQASEALRLATIALGDGRLRSEETADGAPAAVATYTALIAEELDLFDREIQFGFADARARGSAFHFMTASSGAAMAAVMRGDTASAVAHGEAAMTTWPDVPRRLIVERRFGVAIRFLAEAHLLRGELDQARSVVAQGVEVGDLDTVGHRLIRYARGLLAIVDRDYRRALDDFLALGSISALAGWEDRNTPWRLGAAEALGGLGERAQAIRFADEALAIASAWGAPGGLGVAQRARALAGDPDEASRRLAEAVATLRASKMRVELARGLTDYGIALRRDGQRTDARRALAEGMDLAALCEAKPLVERARDELHILGARPRRLMFSGIEGLTATERRVARMAAEGLTNRETAQALFVTTKTIETHLSSVYRKLDIKSRTELPAIFSEPQRLSADSPTA